MRGSPPPASDAWGRDRTVIDRGLTFTCSNCGGTFEKMWSDAAALNESRELWGELPPEDADVICDPCFRQFMAWTGSE
jgi:hypothetical protein